MQGKASFLRAGVVSSGRQLIRIRAHQAGDRHAARVDVGLARWAADAMKYSNFGLDAGEQAAADFHGLGPYRGTRRSGFAGANGPSRHALSNGQLWVENEPGRRRIAAGQDVIIRRHRWHFEMVLDSQPNAAVRRIEQRRLPAAPITDFTPLPTWRK